jgi:hypothetical protein
MDRMEFRTAFDAMDEAVPLFTGDKEEKGPLDWDTDGQVTIEQDEPLPMTVLAIIQEMYTSG